ncbi:MAG: DegQ family serine endoprotease [Burkholderiales bacterium]|nr:DegQ family serine endoprotease [Burkholderiales bacterium]
MIRITMNRLLLACVLALGAFAAGWTPQPAAAQARQLPDFADLVERAAPAVVNIRTAERVRERTQMPQFPFPEGLDENDPFYEFFRRFFPPRQAPSPGPRGHGDEVPRGVGSGFVISSDGYVMTNHHVVDGADEIYVTLADKREFRGKLIGSDRRTDVALVKIEVADLPRLPIGDSRKLRVGEWVIAIGSPFGFDSTVTAGIVSAKSRDTGEYLPFIQTDVAVNPGNSGGPLLNMAGEVVGINSQIYSRTGGFMGISFAIPIDEAMRVADQLRASGRVIRGRIGVGIAEVTREVAEPLGLPKAAGALVRSLEPGGPADKAGIEVGDIIQRFDGKPVERSSDLPRLVGGTRPGTKVSVQVWRRGEQRSLTIAVAEMESDQVATPSGRQLPPRGGGAPPKVANALGLVVSDIPVERKQQLRLRNGVLVESAEGVAARAGIRGGDIVMALNNQEVSSARQFAELVGKLDLSRTAVLLVRRGENAQFVPVRPERR